MSTNFLKIILFGFMAILSFVFIYPLFLADRYQVIQEKYINNTVEITFHQTFHFDSLKRWNLFLDEDLKFDSIQQLGKKYPWRAKMFGSGKIQVDSIYTNNKIHSTIFIEEPFESKINIVWDITSTGSTQTLIKCTVSGSLSYPFGRFLEGQMVNFINSKLQKSFNKLEQRNS